jgi:hypothetical protein
MNDGDECHCGHDCHEDDDCLFELIEGKTELDEGEEFVHAVSHPIFVEEAQSFLDQFYPGMELRKDWRHPPKSLSLATNFGAYLLLEMED